MLLVRKSKAGRQFLGCDKYPDCTSTLPLPPYGLIKKSEDSCICSWPKMMALQKGKKPWFFCANPECPTRKDLGNPSAKEKHKALADLGNPSQ